MAQEGYSGEMTTSVIYILKKGGDGFMDWLLRQRLEPSKMSKELIDYNFLRFQDIQKAEGKTRVRPHLRETRNGKTLVREHKREKPQPKRESEEAKKLRDELAGFTGTEHYYQSMMRSVVYTDGVQWLAGKAEAFWLIDAIVSHQIKPRVRRMPFQIWVLKVYADNSAVLTMQEDTGRGQRARVRQDIPYSDFPLAEMKLYLEEGWVGDEQTGRKVMVLMLPSER